MAALPALIVLGAGGHARVLIDALQAAGRRVLGCTDAAAHGSVLPGVPVLGDDTVLARHDPAQVQLVNGLGSVGDPSRRRALQQRLEAAGWTFARVHHPAATVSPHARLGSDTQLLAGAVVQAGAVLGRGVIVNTAAVVEHDVQLGDWVHVAPRACLLGGASVGADSHIGAGAVVGAGLRLGPRCLVGLGAVVVRDHAGDAVLVGLPARPRPDRA